MAHAIPSGWWAVEEEAEACSGASDPQSEDHSSLLLTLYPGPAGPSLPQPCHGPQAHLVGDGQPGQGAEAQQGGGGHGGSGGSHGRRGGQRVHRQLWAVLLLHHDGAEFVSQRPRSMLRVWGKWEDLGSGDAQGTPRAQHLVPTA